MLSPEDRLRYQIISIRSIASAVKLTSKACIERTRQLKERFRLSDFDDVLGSMETIALALTVISDETLNPNLFHLTFQERMLAPSAPLSVPSPLPTTIATSPCQSDSTGDYERKQDNHDNDDDNNQKILSSLSSLLPSLSPPPSSSLPPMLEDNHLPSPSTIAQKRLKVHPRVYMKPPPPLAALNIRLSKVEEKPLNHAHWIKLTYLRQLPPTEIKQLKEISLSVTSEFASVLRNFKLKARSTLPHYVKFNNDVFLSVLCDNNSPKQKNKVLSKLFRNFYTCIVCTRFSWHVGEDVDPEEFKKLLLSYHAAKRPYTKSPANQFSASSFAHAVGDRSIEALTEEEDDDDSSDNNSTEDSFDYGDNDNANSKKEAETNHSKEIPSLSSSASSSSENHRKMFRCLSKFSLTPSTPTKRARI